MNDSIYQHALDELTAKNQLRSLPTLQYQGQAVVVTDVQQHAQSIANVFPLINIASNDYLAIGADSALQAEFSDYLYALPKDERPRLGAVSSRLLTGNGEQLQRLEAELSDWYTSCTSTIDKPNTIHNSNTTFQTSTLPSVSDVSALVVNSGYHANIGVLPAIAVLPHQVGNTLILADKRIHASLIDGIRLASLHRKCQYKRYAHNDYVQVTRLVEQAGEDISRIIIVTESVFSMDGDVADLVALANIKKTDTRVELYVDEAHAVGVFGDTGFGLADSTKTLVDIDYLIGTFGKAFASVGAYIICTSVVREWLINSMRPLIYSTALPPMTHAWTRFVLSKIHAYNDRRQYLQSLSQQVRDAVICKTAQANSSQSAIIPYILGDNNTALKKSMALRQAGFYALAIRPPTVPMHTSRIRLVMHAGINEATCQRLIDAL